MRLRRKDKPRPPFAVHSADDALLTTRPNFEDARRAAANLVAAHGRTIIRDGRNEVVMVFEVG